MYLSVHPSAVCNGRQSTQTFYVKMVPVKVQRKSKSLCISSQSWAMSQPCLACLNLYLGLFSQY